MLMQDRHIAQQVEVATLGFIRASGDHARAEVLAANQPRNEQAQADVRFWEATKDRHLAKLTDWCRSLQGAGHSEAAAEFLNQAMRHAQLEVILATQDTLRAAMQEAA